MHKLPTHLRAEITNTPPQTDYVPSMFGFNDLNGTGKGVKICVVDSGIPGHKHVKNVQHSANFTTDKEIKDFQGKSTAVCGLLTGKSSNFSGICKNASLYVAKSTENTGLMRFDAAIAAVLWGIIHQVDIIAIPTELEESCDILANAISKAIDNNITVVMAGSELYPSISVKNVSNAENKSSYFESSKTICVNGNNLHSTFLNDEYACCHGVSCSVAITVGVIAQLIEKNKTQGSRYNPKLLLNQLMQSIIET